MVVRVVLLAVIFSLILPSRGAEPSHDESAGRSRNVSIDCTLPTRLVQRDRECRPGSHERSFNSEVHVATVDFERVQVILIVTLFIMIVVLAKLGGLEYSCVVVNLCVFLASGDEMHHVRT